MGAFWQIALSMNVATYSRRWVIGLLILISAGVIGFLIVVPSSANRSLGTCLVAIGAFNILLHRAIGRQVFRQTQTMPPFISTFWKHFDKEGSEILYLGIDIILATAGLFLLIRSA
jgi:hypothetical protein